MKLRLCHAFVFVVVLVFLSLLFAARECRAYTDYSFSVAAKIDADGDAHVIEKSVFNLDTDAERAEFDAYQGLGKTTIADWRKFSKNIKYHFSGSVTNPRIIASRELEVRSTAASVSVEYDVVGVFDAEKVGSRITRYSLNADKLALGGAESKGEISLGNNMRFSFELPPDAFSVQTVPEPGVARPAHNTLEWQGPIVGKWDVEYEREKPLTTEVKEFFMQLYEQLSTWWILLIILAAFIVLAAVKLVKGRK
jgi:hypothetical protein